jgi:cyclopropane-fatty-acyl-phospholipid synthase
VLILHNWNLAHQSLTNGTIGVAESYMAGDWESPDVTAFLELFLVNVEVGTTWPAAHAASLRLVEQIRHWLRSNRRTQARKNISAHYDLGNAFYSNGSTRP